MKRSVSCMLVLHSAIGLLAPPRSQLLGHRFPTLRSSNTDMFGSSSGGSESGTTSTVEDVSSVEANKFDESANKFMSEAARLRKEAAEMELALRDEARSKGLPEEVINKLIPVTTNKPAAPAASTSTAIEKEVTVKAKSPASEVRSKLGYLNTGDAVRITTELDRIKRKGILQDWNSRDIKDATFRTNNLQLKVKTGIEPQALKLDDVGFDYQLVFGAAIISATVLALGSSQIGGQLGFIMGYLSALLPIALVGIGSIAPALIGDIINQVTYLTNEEAKRKHINMNAGKFLAGYVLGLPVSRFSTSGPSNSVEFFQLRPSGKTMSVEEKQMFARSQFKQNDIARASIVCLAGSVAECMTTGEASGRNAADVNTLYELMNSVDPPLTPERLQDHIRWSAVNAYEIIDSRKEQFSKLVLAFEQKLPLEECIACLEGMEPPTKLIELRAPKAAGSSSSSDEEKSSGDAQ